MLLICCRISKTPCARGSNLVLPVDIAQPGMHIHDPKAEYEPCAQAVSNRAATTLYCTLLLVHPGTNSAQSTPVPSRSVKEVQTHAP